MNKKQIQFELWEECNSKCKFCYLGTHNCVDTVERKLYGIQNAIDVINKLNFDEYDTIALMGGELFQGQLSDTAVKHKFFDLITLIHSLSQKKLVKSIWLYATLTIGDQKDLYDTLSLLKDDNVWVLTSYDTLGRFHTDKMFRNWEYHVKQLKNIFKVHLNVTSIITGDLIDRYLDGTFSFKNLINSYNCSVFPKLCSLPYGLYSTKAEMNEKIGNFFPNRKKFIEFITKLKKDDLDSYNKMFNINYRADTLYVNFEDRIIEETRDKTRWVETDGRGIPAVLKCGHSEFYNCYIDSDKCALCDKLVLDRTEE